MNKVAVIFEGKYGSTEQYAKWICEETGGDLFTASACKAADLAGYDTVIFGGALRAGAVRGIDKFKKLYPSIAEKRIFCFVVGLNVEDEAAQKECRELNFVKQENSFMKIFTRKMTDEERMSERELAFSKLPLYFFRGAYDPAKVSGVDKTMMGMVKKLIGTRREEEVTQSERKLLEAIDHGADYVNRSEIKALVEAVKAGA